MPATTLTIDDRTPPQDCQTMGEVRLGVDAIDLGARTQLRHRLTIDGGGGGAVKPTGPSKQSQVVEAAKDGKVSATFSSPDLGTARSKGEYDEALAAL